MRCIIGVHRYRAQRIAQLDADECMMQCMRGHDSARGGSVSESVLSVGLRCRLLRDL